jgi:hypothetical protein
VLHGICDVLQLSNKARLATLSASGTTVDRCEDCFVVLGLPGGIERSNGGTAGKSTNLGKRAYPSFEATVPNGGEVEVSLASLGVNEDGVVLRLVGLSHVDRRDGLPLGIMDAVQLRVVAYGLKLV